MLEEYKLKLYKYFWLNDTGKSGDYLYKVFVPTEDSKVLELIRWLCKWQL